ncbi:MAG: DsrE family protein [Burkholderiales bacterium]|jgi:intracellular sulfur oxidation DsrE/DsrF family protein|nr:DsrE family protein [Burkholderiales bacterium]
MDCTRTRQLAQPYVDGELDLTASLALEEHLAACAACRAQHEALRRVRAAVGAGIGVEPAPAELRQRIARQVCAQARCERPWWRRPAAWLAVPAVLMLAFATLFASLAYQQWAAMGEERIVYHINESTNPATALRNLANHVESNPNLRAVVVAHNKGIDFLLAGARDADSGDLFEEAVAALRARGVDFRVCGNTLARRAISPAAVIPEATLVPSGVAEIGRLQTRERYAYLRL